MKTWMWLGLATAALLLVGLVFGFAPVKSDGYDCGSAFRESDTLMRQEFQKAITGGDSDSGCASARSGRQPVAWSAIGVGCLLGVATIATRQADRRNG